MGRRLGFFVTLVRDAERANQRAQREHARMAKANSRIQARRARERNKADAAAYKRARAAEAEDLTSDVEQRFRELQDAFSARPRNAAFDVSAAERPEDAFVRVFKRLRPTFTRSIFAAGAAVGPRPEPPTLESMRRTVPPPSGLQRIFGGAKKHAAEVERVAREDAERFAVAMTRHQAAMAEWESRVDDARRKHEASMQRLESETREKLVAVDEWEAGVRDGDPEAVVQYIAHVLDTSDYPEEIDEAYDASYNPEARVLTLAYMLPIIDVVPADKAFTYVRASDEIRPKPRAKTEVVAVYRSLIVALSLRTIRELFTAVPSALLESITFHGLVDGVDPSTGRTGQVCVISAHVPRNAVESMGRGFVDPAAFLLARGGVVSKKPEALVPVRRVDEGGRRDVRFVSSSR
ncbi:MAG: hypothetical protein V4813_13185 [Gemmatimonadota bacterium]